LIDVIDEHFGQHSTFVDRLLEAHEHTASPSGLKGYIHLICNTLRLISHPSINQNYVSSFQWLQNHDRWQNFLPILKAETLKLFQGVDFVVPGFAQPPIYLAPLGNIQTAPLKENLLDVDSRYAFALRFSSEVSSNEETNVQAKNEQFMVSSIVGAKKKKRKSRKKSKGTTTNTGKSNYALRSQTSKGNTAAIIESNVTNEEENNNSSALSISEDDLVENSIGLDDEDSRNSSGDVESIQATENDNINSSDWREIRGTTLNVTISNDLDTKKLRRNTFSNENQPESQEDHYSTTSRSVKINATRSSKRLGPSKNSKIGSRTIKHPSSLMSDDTPRKVEPIIMDSTSSLETLSNEFVRLDLADPVPVTADTHRRLPIYIPPPTPF